MRTLLPRFRLAACAALASAPAAGQSWPNKPVTVIVPFPAGGGTDAFARPLFAQLTKQLGQTSHHRQPRRRRRQHRRGARRACRARRLYLAHGRGAPCDRADVYPKLDYNLATTSFRSALIASVPQVVVVNPQRVPAKTSRNSSPCRMTRRQAQLRLGRQRHLASPRRRAVQAADQDDHHPRALQGRGPALQDLIGGQVDVMFDGLGSSATHIKSGKLKPLAVASTKRAPGFPDIPTSVEAGMPSTRSPRGTALGAEEHAEVVDRMARRAEGVRIARTAYGVGRPRRRAPGPLWCRIRRFRRRRNKALGRRRKGRQHQGWTEGRSDGQPGRSRLEHAGAQPAAAAGSRRPNVSVRAPGQVRGGRARSRSARRVIEPGDRVCLEGNNQKQADFLAAR